VLTGLYPESGPDVVAIYIDIIVLMWTLGEHSKYLKDFVEKLKSLVEARQVAVIQYEYVVIWKMVEALGS